ncbi:MAG: GtrA family protein [Gammaproteobacteria bacterium]|nr:GtrA family protein [Gammaproteobacteria bacterium]
MDKSTYISIRYGIFALIAIGANVITQEASIRIYSGSSYTILLSILNGTVIGLLVKYNLDKRHIFNFYPTSTLDDFKVFLTYAATGIVTTLIFWTTEIGFQIVYESKSMRYTGAIIGLTIGYTVKYFLDYHFVFSKPKNQDR